MSQYLTFIAMEKASFALDGLFSNDGVLIQVEFYGAHSSLW